MSAAAKRRLVDWGVVSVFEGRCNTSKIIRVRKREGPHFYYPASSSQTPLHPYYSLPETELKATGDSGMTKGSQLNSSAKKSAVSERESRAKLVARS